QRMEQVQRSNTSYEGQVRDLEIKVRDLTAENETLKREKAAATATQAGPPVGEDLSPSTKPGGAAVGLGEFLRNEHGVAASDPDEAGKIIMQAVEIGPQLLQNAKSTDVTTQTSQLAYALEGIGEADYKKRRFDEASQVLTEARDLYRRLVNEKFG